MNSAERVFAALKLQQPDQVPIIESVIDERVRRALFPRAVEVGAFNEAIGLDAVSCGPEFRRHNETADTYQDEWGVLYGRSPEELGHPVRGPISSREDLETYQPPDPEAPWRLGRLPELVERYKGQKAILVHYRAAFMWSAYLMGLDHLLMNFALEPELSHALLDKVLETNMAVVRRAIRAGADIITTHKHDANTTQTQTPTQHRYKRQKLKSYTKNKI